MTHICIAKCTPKAYVAVVVFTETSIFTKQITGLLSDEEYRIFQLELLRNPNAGALIRGSGGLRKIRHAANGKGKSGGIRVIYYLWTSDRILLLTAYAKSAQENLTEAQLKKLRTFVEKNL